MRQAPPAPPPVDRPSPDRPPTDRPPTDRPSPDRPPVDAPPLDRPPLASGHDALPAAPPASSGPVPPPRATPDAGAPAGPLPGPPDEAVGAIGDPRRNSAPAAADAPDAAPQPRAEAASHGGAAGSGPGLQDPSAGLQDTTPPDAPDAVPQSRAGADPHGAAAPADAGPQDAPEGPPPAAPPGPAADAASVPPPADAWRRYDPWAAPAAGPLQADGAGLDGPALRRRRVRRALVGGAVALALASGALGGLAGAYIERNGGVGAVQLPQAGREPAGRAPDSVAGIAARALPSVVTLHVTGSDEQGTGTGFVLDSLGHILTNNHVVESAASGGAISVTFSGGQTAKAEIVGRDSGYDLAVVQVHGVRGLTPIPLGNSDNVQVGDPVVAIGAPFDLANTVTSGIISAKERPITAGGEKGDGSDLSYVDALQTDAPINPGNSGGPLLDSRARVVGINSAIRSADSGSDLRTGQSGSIGLGFAIPVNQARRVAEELINTGHATHPVIGVTLDMNYTGDGARVGAKGRDGGPAITAGGPGARAGLKAGDVISEVEGARVHSGDELIVRIRAHRPGDHLRLTVVRDGRRRAVTLVLGSAHGT
ncbi:trypsin-like peptidase domain-containing protein [Streptomyces tropicalis]